MSDKKRADLLEKISSGIEGFDDITGGGLPLRRTILLMGGPECGKTLSALQMLVSGATRHHTPGIFVAFEEDARRVAVNAETCGWELRVLEQKNRLFFVNACTRSDVVKSGAFDITGLLAVPEAKSHEKDAKLIVFNAIDVLLNLLDVPGAECSELYRLHELAHTPRTDRHRHDEDRIRRTGHCATLRIHASHGRLRGASQPARHGSRGRAFDARAQIPQMTTTTHPLRPSLQHSPEKGITLALRLAQAERAIQTFSAGQVDAIVDTDGKTYLLRVAQDHLRQNERRVQILMESVTDGITVIDRGGIIVFQNRAATRMFGYETGDLLSQSLFLFVHPDDLKVLYSAFLSVIEEYQPDSFVQFRHRNRDGSDRMLEATVSKFRDATVAHVILICRDLPRRRLAWEGGPFQHNDEPNPA